MMVLQAPLGCQETPAPQALMGLWAGKGLLVIMVPLGSQGGKEPLEMTA